MKKPRVHYLVIAPAAMIICGLLLSGCSGAGVGASASQQQNNHSSSVHAPDNCDGYNALSESNRKKAFADKTIRVYEADGVVKIPVTAIYDKRCATHHGDDYALINIKLDASEPSCSVFVTLTPAQQEKWMPSLENEQYWHGGFDAGTLAKGCKDFGFAAIGDNLIRLSNELGDFSSGYAFWDTETKLGYTWRDVLGLGSLETGHAVKEIIVGPGEGSSDPVTSFTPGHACGFNPTTDAIIPLALGYTNTTKGKGTISLDVAWQLNVVGGSEPVTTAFLEGHYSGGDSKCSQAADGYGSANAGSNFDKASSDGENSEDFYVVLKNWFSPRYPKGATGDLKDYELTSIAESPNSDDPVVSSTKGTILLDGTPLG
jgi:hypothetical protein